MLPICSCMLSDFSIRALTLLITVILSHVPESVSYLSLVVTLASSLQTVVLFLFSSCLLACLLSFC